VHSPSRTNKTQTSKGRHSGVTAFWAPARNDAAKTKATWIFSGLNKYAVTAVIVTKRGRCVQWDKLFPAQWNAKLPWKNEVLKIA
jgi:hypothetical protein